jgi:peptide-methionine (S)-S-oxide reductase
MGNAGGKAAGPATAEILQRAAASAPATAGAANPTFDTATFAGGCFWGLELAFQRLPGVVKTEVGYTAGLKKNPTYDEVCSGSTGHTEGVQVTYDYSIIYYDDLLVVFWEFINPTTFNKQGNDVGTQYRSGIYYHSNAQEKAAMKSRDEVPLHTAYSIHHTTYSYLLPIYYLSLTYILTIW